MSIADFVSARKLEDQRVTAERAAFNALHGLSVPRNIQVPDWMSDWERRSYGNDTKLVPPVHTRLIFLGHNGDVGKFWAVVDGAHEHVIEVENHAQCNRTITEVDIAIVPLSYLEKFLKEMAA
jgi:hypothetical protein